MKDKAKDKVTAAADEIRHLGDFIRDQRAGSGISLRQLSTLAGVSNPYLSQIERGLRKPSAEILQQIAKGLRISAEALYVQAGLLEQRTASGPVVDAVMSDNALSERQKQVLVEIYASFRRDDAVVAPTDDDVVVSVVTATGNVASSVAGPGAAGPGAAEPGAAEPATPTPAARKRRRKAAAADPEVPTDPTV